MDKDELLKKWRTLLNGLTQSNDLQSNQLVSEHQGFESDYPGILPLAKKVAAQTIGLNLVSVQPIDGLTKQERERLEAEIKQENRDAKIDTIVEGKEFTEKTIKDHPDYKSGPQLDLIHLDFKYGLTNSI